MTDKLESHSETYFTVQFSPAGAEDWAEVSTDTYDTLAGARAVLARYRANGDYAYAYRVVRKTIIEDPVSEQEAV